MAPFTQRNYKTVLSLREAAKKVPPLVAGPPPSSLVVIGFFGTFLGGFLKSAFY